MWAIGKWAICHSLNNTKSECNKYKKLTPRTTSSSPGMKTNSHTCFDVIILYLISSSSFPSTNPSYPPSRSIYGASTSHSIHSPLCSPPVSPFRSRYSSSFLYSTSLPSNQGQLPSILAQVVPPASGLFVLFMR